MERFRLKNIIILILVLLNAFLLFSLAQRRAEEPINISSIQYPP